MATPRKKKPTLEEELRRIAELGRGSLSEDDLAELSRVIELGQSLPVARAARVVRERSIGHFAKVLEASFRRFLVNAVKSDPGCNAKIALLEALDAAAITDPEPFLVAARHVQKEGAYGPPVDTAVGLRARAIQALANMGHPDIFLIAGELLGDPETGVRQAAAESLAHTGDRNGAGLLLLASARADEDPVVRTAYFSALLTLAPDFAMPRLKTLLHDSDPEQRELAAIALGTSSLEPAAVVLVEAMEATPLASERALYIRALGLHRSERTLTLLCGVIEDGTAADAESAVNALAARRYDAGVKPRVEALVSGRGSLRLSQAFDLAFAE